MADLVIPKTSLETLKRVVRAYYLSHSDDGITVKEVNQKTGYVEAQINKSNKFLFVTKIIEKIDSKYKLTNEGYQYAELQRNNQIEDANRILFQLIKDYNAINLIINFIEIYESVTADELIKRIADVSGSDTKIADHRTGINCLIEILVESGVINQQDNKYEL